MGRRPAHFSLKSGRNRDCTNDSAYLLIGKNVPVSLPDL